MVIRSRAGFPTSGQASLDKPNEILIQSSHGDFDVTFDGVTQTVASGKAYRAVISQSTATVGQKEKTVRKNNHRELTLAIAIVVIEIAVFWYVNKTLTVSPSKPSE